MKKTLAAVTVALILTAGISSPAMAAKKKAQTYKGKASVSRVLSVSACPPGTRLVAIRYLPGTYQPGMPTHRCV